MASFILLMLSGIVLSLFGPQWWHSNTVGHFFKSIMASKARSAQKAH